MNLANPHFAEPQWLWLAVAGPVVAWLLFRYAARKRHQQLAAFAAPDLLPTLLQSHSPPRRAFKHALLALSVALMALALARPQWGQTSETGRSLGEDIVFLLDASKSMLAPDVQPNRLQRAKFAILDFVERHGRGRVGLVAFAGQAFLQCPLTSDYDAFRDALAAVDERTIPVGGTDIGRALDEATKAMEKTTRRKVLVLLTDGEDLEAGGVAKAKALAEQGVVVFTLGVGTPTGATIQYVDERGAVTVVRDSKGEPVRSRLDEKTLREIATATRGGYEPLGALGEGMVRVRQAVESSASLTNLVPARKLGVDRFQWFLAPALLLLVAESLRGTRRKSAVKESAAV
jgi:Ca-activated chloride channel homolog